tara:strand:+ start:259 stop:591 length:333 start_codon:yes stop_codon:yes gene_type:complete
MSGLEDSTIDDTTGVTDMDDSTGFSTTPFPELPFNIINYISHYADIIPRIATAQRELYGARMAEYSYQVAGLPIPTDVTRANMRRAEEILSMYVPLQRTLLRLRYRQDDF